MSSPKRSEGLIARRALTVEMYINTVFVVCVRIMKVGKHRGNAVRRIEDVTDHPGMISPWASTLLGF